MEFQVLSCNLELLKSKFEKLNRKCKAYGNEELSFEIKESFKQDNEEWSTIEVSGCTPLVENCELIAVISKLDDGTNVVNIVPGKECPEKYRQANFNECSHCNISRYRKEVVIVRNEDGEYKQLGKTCLKDYLGVSLENLVNRFTYVYELCNEAKEYLGERQELIVSPQRFLEAASVCIEKFGFVGSKDWDRTPTKSDAWRVCFPWSKADRDFIREYELYPSDKNKENVVNALQWLEQQSDKNDFIYNLKQIARQEFVGYKYIGYLAALLPSYYKAVEKEKEEKKQDVPSEWVGQPKDRLTSTAKCVFYKTYESDYGLKSVVKFVTDNNILTWFASNEPDFKVDQEYVIKYTVKNHDTYNNKKQTIVNRVKAIAG